ncbi:MAG: response regulator transcription factor [Bacteroidota bacterium]|nr:response regulator transcription factor [Bacteroidota bacterium]
MKKIIIVDDHSLFREGIKLLIENEGLGIVIAEAENGQAFLDLLEKHDPDLVIMDIEMPVMGGLEATRKAREISPDIKILTLTMLSDRANYFDMVNAGSMGFVLKTSGKREFEKAIKAVLNGDTYFSNELLRQIIVNIKTEQSDASQQFPGNEFELSEKEYEVLRLFCEGLTASEIADRIFRSVKTVEAHRSSLLKKTNTKNTINLVLFAIKSNLVDI